MQAAGKGANGIDQHVVENTGIPQTIIKQLSKAPHSQTQRVSVESGAFMFHNIVSDGVVYLTLAEKGYPKKLAFQYLEELRKEFTSLYGAQIEGTTRPYAFIRFGTPGLVFHT